MIIGVIRFCVKKKGKDRKETKTPDYKFYPHFHCSEQKGPFENLYLENLGSYFMF